jgi:ABC-2 type transport system permease protein
VYYLLLVLCGINFPISRLPEVVQVASYGLPLTRGVEAAREVATGASITQIGGLLLGELLVGVVYALAGYMLFRWARGLRPPRRASRCVLISLAW